MSKRLIYMDNAATTRLAPGVLDAMLPYLKDEYANPGGLYDPAGQAKRAVACAREDLAGIINAHPTEIFFTCGGTESDNWAVRSVAYTGSSLSGNASRGHIITTGFEHHAVLESCRYLEKQGFRVSYVNPSSDGHIKTEDVMRLIRDDTVLISIMLINNELGTIQPVKETAEAAHERGILFHTDAVAAYGHIPIDVKDLGVDLMSVSAHKFGGPKGIGFLFVREGLGLKPFMLGGGQERGRRAGTENVPGIVGMARAARLAHDRMDENLKRRRELDKYFLKKFEGLRESLPDIIVRAGGDFDRDDGRLPGCFSLTFPGMDAEELIVRLSMEGICISAGAACASSSEEGSHVLTALGLDKRTVRSSVRITMNEDNTEEETDILFDSLVVKLKKER